MNRFRLSPLAFAAVLAAVVLAPAELAAQPSAPARIGVISPDTVIRQSARGKAFFEVHDAWAAERRAELEGLVERLREAEKNAQALAAMATEERRQAMATELQQLARQVQQRQQEVQAEAEKRVQEGLGRINNDLVPIIEALARERDLDVILAAGSGNGVIFAHDRVNLNAEVIRRYDAAATTVTAPPAAAAPAPATPPAARP